MKIKATGLILVLGVSPNYLGLGDPGIETSAIWSLDKNGKLQGTSRK